MANKLWTSFLERIEGIAPGSASFDSSGGTAKMDFVVARDQMPGIATNILGASAVNQNGGLNRSVPLAHPEFNWLYATKISTVQGIGPYGIDESGKGPLSVADNIDRAYPQYFCLFEKYRISVQFEARPYLVLTDEQLAGFSATRRDYVGTDLMNTTQWTDPAEWGRFVSVRRKPKAELLPSNYGSFYMISPDLGGTGFQQVNQATGAGPRIPIVMNEVEIKWYFVPFYMTQNTNWKKTYGTVHSNGAEVQPFYDFSTGSLLLQGIEYEDYAGPEGRPHNLNAAIPETLRTAIYENRYCDITFKCLEFEIPGILKATLPNIPVPQWPPPGLVTEGHNRVPSAKLMKWCYANGANNFIDWKPIFLSTDYRRLFRMN